MLQCCSYPFIFGNAIETTVKVMCKCSCEVFSMLTRSLMFSLRQSFSYSSNSLRHFHTDVVFMRAEHQILV